MKQAVFLIKIAIVVFVVAIVLRFAGYHNANPIPPIGVTPGALHRLTDTVFLCAIALALVEIHRVLQGRKDIGLPESNEEKPEE